MKDCLLLLVTLWKVALEHCAARCMLCTIWHTFFYLTLSAFHPLLYCVCVVFRADAPIFSQSWEWFIAYDLEVHGYACGSLILAGKKIYLHDSQIILGHFALLLHVLTLYAGVLTLYTGVPTLYAGVQTLVYRCPDTVCSVRTLYVNVLTLVYKCSEFSDTSRIHL